jgi:Tol biopolymer transport system component
MKYDLQNGQEQQISEQKFYVINNLAWMPDGKALIISARKSRGEFYQLWRISEKDGPVARLFKDPAAYSNVSFDKTGSKFLATKITNDFQISLYSFNNLTNKKFLARAHTASFISNNEIVFSNAEHELWKIGLDGQGLYQLTKNNSINDEALAVTDSKHLYFRSNRTGANQVWRIEEDGTSVTQITKKIGGVPKFASKEKNLLWYESNLHRTIWEASLDQTRPEKQIWDKKLFYSAISRDGKKIAYLHRVEDEKRQLEIEIADLEKMKVLINIPLWKKSLKPVKLAWLNDNKTLLFITRDGADYKLWKQTISDNPPEFVADLGKEQIRDFSVSPDGQNFLVISGEWLRDVILFEGFKNY